MKIVLCAVILSVVAIASVHMKVMKIEDPHNCLFFRRGLQTVGSEVYKDIFVKPYPETQMGKCAYECMLRVAGMIDDESQLDYHNFANFLYRQGDWFGGIEQEQIMIAASKCYVGYEDRPPCEKVGRLIKCASEKAKAMDDDQFKLIAAFRTPYLAMMSRNSSATSQANNTGVHVISKRAATILQMGEEKPDL